MSKRTSSAVAFVALLAGCAAPPKVGYSLVSAPSDLTDEMLATYALQENVVTIKSATTGEGAKAKTTISATIDREDHEGVRIALLKKGAIGVDTDISIKRFDNTDIPSEVTVKVTDSRVDLIKKAGEVVISLVKSGLVPFSGTPANIELPARVNLSALLSSAQRSEVSINPSPGNPLHVDFGAVPPDAVETSAANLPPSGSYFYYAACRKAIVSFRFENVPYTYTFKVADPHFLQRQRMPIDGKISMHSQCGVSVTGKMSGDDAASTLAITAALIEQGSALRDALKGEGEEDK